MISRGHSAASNRLAALRARHAELSKTLDQESRLPSVDDLELRRLKLEKLRIKDQMEFLSQAS